jgi:hypothetical protein
MPDNETVLEPETESTEETQTETEGPQDALAALITALNASGITFVRDTWIDENNDMGRSDYGVVTLTGEPLTLYGDDKLIKQEMNGNVILYVMDGDDAKAKAVQDILKEYAGLSFRLINSGEFLRDLIANRWIWRFSLEEYF